MITFFHRWYTEALIIKIVLHKERSKEAKDYINFTPKQLLPQILDTTTLYLV